MKMVFILTAVFVFAMILIAAFAPGYLSVVDSPRKADAIVLFVGPDNHARRSKAEQLVKEGYSRYLLIPNLNKVYEKNPAGGLSQVAGSRTIAGTVRNANRDAAYAGFYENTHIEALEAKRMMDEMGLRSALLVSSAFHMRRISLIAGRVFDTENYEIACTPAPGIEERFMTNWLDSGKRFFIVSEYIKIAWYLAYSGFDALGSPRKMKMTARCD